MLVHAFLITVFLTFPGFAKERTILFLGNSYTYYPMQPDRPGLPFFIQEIAKSIDAETKVRETCHTIPNASLEVHFNNNLSRAMMEGSYDEVVLQGRSTDPLPVPIWFRKNGMMGLRSFKLILPQVLQIVLPRSANVTLFVPWGYHPKHEYFQASDSPFKSASAGEWAGQTGAAYQQLINQGYIESAKGYPVAFSFVGNEWNYLVQLGLVRLDDLYVPNDWSHPSPLGSMIAALVLTRDVLRLDIEKNKFAPQGIDPKLIEKISSALVRRM